MKAERCGKLEPLQNSALHLTKPGHFKHLIKVSVSCWRLQPEM